MENAMILSEDNFRYEIARWIRRMFSSKKVAAKHLNVSEQYLGDFLAGKRAPGAKLLRALHAERQILYKWGSP